MTTKGLGKAPNPQSSFDLSFASNENGGIGRAQDTEDPTVCRDPLFSLGASPGRSSPFQINGYPIIGSNDPGTQESLTPDYAPASISLPIKESVANVELVKAIKGPFIGELMSSHVMSKEYAKADPVYLSKTCALTRIYSHYRPVLGDGNCGWSAVAFSYFEKLIEPANQEMLHSEVARITSLNNLLNTVGLQEWAYEDIVQETIDLLKELSRMSESCQALESSKKLILQRFSEFGVANSIVYHLRLLASAWLKTNLEHYKDFLPDGLTVEEYSRNWIEAVNQEIDHLGMVLLIDVLLKPASFSVEIVCLDKNEGSHSNTHLFRREDSNSVPIDPGSPVIHLLYRPSHYDILYKDTISTPVYSINGVLQDVNIQVNRVTSFRGPRILPVQGDSDLSSLPKQIFDGMDACIPGFHRSLQQSSDQSSLKSGSHFEPSNYERALATPRASVSTLVTSNSSERTPSSSWTSCLDIEPPIIFTKRTFKNPHYNPAHYDNPNFQHESWLPESEEQPGDKPDGRRKRAMNQSRSNESSIRDNLVASVVDIDQSSANLEVSPEKTSSNEHNDLVVVSATGTDGLEKHHEQPLTADSASQDAETELVLPLDSSDSDYESSDLGDFSKAFEAVQWLRMEGIAQDPNQNIQDTATPFSIVKQTAFDQGMRAFWTIFDQAWSVEFTGCVTRHEESPETADLPATHACNNSAAALTTVTALGKRSRNEDDSEAPDDDDRNNGHKRNKSTPYSKSSMIASGFACPYRKHDALQYSVGKWKICALTPQSTVARVKEHLYRYHRVHQCQRCKDCFKEEKELDAHFEAKEGCESRPMKIVEGITAKMEKQLRCRKKAYRGQSESERWKEIYKLLFPQEAVPDPYFEPVRELKTEQSSLSSDSQDIADYEGYLRRELPRCFRRALEAAISDDNDPIEDRLTGRIMDMYQDCQDLVLSSYRTSLEAASTAIPTFVPEPTIELVAQVAEYNVATWNTGSPIDVDEGSSNTCPNYPQRYDGITTPSRGSETMQSNKAMNGDTGNDFHFDFTPNGPGIPPQELSSSTIIADWQTSSEIAAYPVQMNTVPLRHVNISNSFEWDDLLRLDP